MAKKKKIEFTAEQKREFIANNLQVKFWMDKQTLLDFDKLMELKGLSRKEGIIKLMEKYVDKHKELLVVEDDKEDEIEGAV